MDYIPKSILSPRPAVYLIVGLNFLARRMFILGRTMSSMRTIRTMSSMRTPKTEN